MLDLPEPDQSRLQRSPLELVVCQIRYENTLAASDSHTALAFHESLGGRGGRYPRMEQAQSQMLNISAGPQIQPAAQVTAAAGWRFASNDGWTATLMPDHLSLETSAYTTWEGDFFPRVSELLEAAAQHLNPAFEQRLGLRYVDRISELQLNEPKSWEPFIRPEVLGPVLHPDLGDSIRAAQQLLLLNLDEGVACNFRHGFLDATHTSQVDYLLDYDVFRQEGRPFEVGGIRAALNRFNILALALFQASITPALLDRLRGDSDD